MTLGRSLNDRELKKYKSQKKDAVSFQAILYTIVDSAESRDFGALSIELP